MAGGQQDDVKRQLVKNYLLTEKGQYESDNEVAKQVGVSRLVVSSVRRVMIVAGEHPAKTTRPISYGSDNVMARVYLPGQSARGGYVFAPDGSVIRESAWLLLVQQSPELQGMIARGEAKAPIGWELPKKKEPSRATKKPARPKPRSK